MKQNITPVELCKTFPSEVLLLLEHARELSFTAKPDYARMQSLFQDLHARLDNSQAFDWQALPYSIATLPTANVQCEPTVMDTGRTPRRYVENLFRVISTS